MAFEPFSLHHVQVSSCEGRRDGGQHCSVQEEDFLQISVDVVGKGSLEKSLEAYVQVCAQTHMRVCVHLYVYA